MDKLIEKQIKKENSTTVLPIRRAFDILSKEIRPPFSLNEHELCFKGERIASAKRKQKISNNKGSIYSLQFEKPCDFDPSTGAISYKSQFLAHDTSEHYKDSPLSQSVSCHIPPETVKITNHGPEKLKKGDMVIRSVPRPDNTKSYGDVVIVEEMASMSPFMISREEEQKSRALRFAITRLLEDLQYEDLKRTIKFIATLDTQDKS